MDDGGGGRRYGHDPYLIPGTDVLENKLGIRDAKELERAERLLTADRLVELATEPVAGNFDLPHLQRIHRAIFQDVYAWAGDLREINISRGGMRFAMTSQLESSAADIFGRLRRDNHLQGLQQSEFARSAAEVLADVNALHPFREGNGRTQREFLRELATRAGFHLDWSRTSAKEMVSASIVGMVGETQALARILKRTSIPIAELGGGSQNRNLDRHERRQLTGSRSARERERWAVGTVYISPTRSNYLTTRYRHSKAAKRRQRLRVPILTPGCVVLWQTRSRPKLHASNSGAGNS